MTKDILNQNHPNDVLQDIKSMMQRSSRFLSLSGWSGIWAGIVALASAAMAHNILGQLIATPRGYTTASEDTVMTQLILLALVTLVIAIAGGFFFTWRKNQKTDTKFWNESSKKLFINLFIPLAVGGFICMIYIYRQQWMDISSITLIFYGLALINGSKYTIADIRYLGILEILLGCVGLLLPGYGLWFWAIGFGALHIIYGIIMWNKYDRA